MMGAGGAIGGISNDGVSLWDSVSVSNRSRLDWKNGGTDDTLAFIQNTTTIGFWVKRYNNSNDFNMLFCSYQSDSDPRGLALYVQNGSLKIYFNGNTGDGAIIPETTIGSLGFNSWLHVLVSFDLSQNNSGNARNQFSVSLNGAYPQLYSSSPTYSTPFIRPTLSLSGFLNGQLAPTNTPTDMYDLYINNIYNDLTSQTFREKFYKNGEPVNLGKRGELVTGTPPRGFFSGKKDQWHINKGSIQTGLGFQIVNPNNFTKASTKP